MGYFYPTLLAFIFNYLGIFIFVDSRPVGCKDLYSSLIFLTGLFLLLCNLKLFPSNLRTLCKCGAIVLNFLLVSFIMELTMNHFWYPLNASMCTLLAQIAGNDAGFFHNFGRKGVLSLLNHKIVRVLPGYAMAVFFLIAVLHATRIFDLRLLRCGVYAFIHDIRKRTRRSMRGFVRKVNNMRNSLHFNRDYDSDSDECVQMQRRKRRCEK